MKERSSDVICIIGMHRSGTSMVAQVLNLCGLDLGPAEQLLTSREDNLSGFFENWRFVEINEALLSHLRGSWDDPPTSQPGWERDPSLEPIVQQAEALLEQFKTSPHWGWKDPRTTILLPFWQSLIHGLKFVICIRNPLDVARSLMKRDGMPIAQAASLWNRYTQAALLHTQGFPRVVVFYDDFFQDPVGETGKLAEFCGVKLPNSHSTLHEAVARELRHHTSDLSEVLYDEQLPVESKLLYAALRALSLEPIVEGGSNFHRDHSLLDRFASLLQFTELLSGSQPAVQMHSLLTQMKAEVASKQQRVTRLEHILQEKDDTLQALQTRVGNLQFILAENQRLLSELHARLLSIEQSPIWKILKAFRSHARRVARFVYRVLPLPIQLKHRADTFASRHFGFIFGKSVLDSTSISTEAVSQPATSTALDSRFHTEHHENIAPPLTLRQELYDETSVYYEPMCTLPVQETQIKLIAFYLPQFHPIAENDSWWGKGFTDWANVAKAKPQYQGHYQPHLPGDVGFYDLRLMEVQKQQIQIARHYGLYGFCYYYYWFNGRQLLDRPLMQVMQNQALDFPFCICWANENWTRRWDGQDHEVLIAQKHSPEGDIAFIQSLEPFLRDHRYIKVDGKPLLIVYRADILPNVKATLKRWRQFCATSGIGDMYIVAARTFGLQNPVSFGFDAAVEFPPHGVVAGEISSQLTLFNPHFRGRIFSYEDVVRHAKEFTPLKYPVFRAAMPSWDNTARRGIGAHIFTGSSPKLYQEWLESACDYTARNFPASRCFVFVNAWNEWAEGTHLEPDRRYGYAYLNATANVLRKYKRRNEQSNRDHRKSISVVVPAYNHEKYIQKALESLEAQTARDFEVIVVNDGSTDRTVDVVKEFMQKTERHNMQLLNQDNAGAHAAINRGIEEATGDYITILNSDDFYHPERLETLLNTLENSDSLLAFSDLEIVGENGEPISREDPYAELLRTKVFQISQFPHIGYALLDFNIAVTTGNLFFKRKLFDLVGGFSALRYCHDWDFVLTALRYTTPLFVRRSLYYYRLHRGNSFRELLDLAEKESQIVLSKFFRFEQSQGQVRRGFPGHKNDSQYFAQFVKQHKYESYVRRALQV